MMPAFFRRAETRLMLAIALAALAIGGAWFSELGLGYVPCKLCLWQRWPYYLALPPAVAALALAGARGGRARAALTLLAGLLGVLFVVSSGLGLYHAGVEWKLWLGPADCGGRVSAQAPSFTDFQKALGKARVVLCDEAPMRVLGLSFAGWNMLASAGIAGLFVSAARGFRRPG